MPSHELEHFLNAWEQQARFTVRVLETLPEGAYDFRPTPEHRSLGEMAWHLAEIDGYMSFGIEGGALNFTNKPPGLERPKDIVGLRKGYERVYADARARILGLRPEDLDRKITFFDGSQVAIRDVLWSAILHHAIHHLGQLSLMCRIAGGTPPGIYGPNREEMQAMRAAMAGKSAS